MTIDKDMAEKIFLGAEVERFIASPIGKFMVHAMEDRREAAVREFASTNPTDSGAVMKIQMKILMADQFQQWLADILIEANEAARVVEHQDFVD